MDWVVDRVHWNSLTITEFSMLSLVKEVTLFWEFVNVHSDIDMNFVELSKEHKKDFTDFINICDLYYSLLGCLLR